MDLKELITTLKTAESADDIDERKDKIEDLIPIVNIMFDYDQKNQAHQYNLWMHSLHTVVNLPRNMEDDMLYLAALFHDIGKPDSKFVSNRPNDTNMHYYGHPQRSMEIVRDIVIQELDKKGFVISCLDVKRLMYYVEYHDDHVSKKFKHLKRHIRLANFEEFKYLMLLQIADAKAHVQIPIIAARVEICSSLATGEGEILFQKYLKERDN